MRTKSFDLVVELRARRLANTEMSWGYYAREVGAWYIFGELDIAYAHTCRADWHHDWYSHWGSGAGRPASLDEIAELECAPTENDSR